MQSTGHDAALTAAMDRYADGDEAAFGEVYDLCAPRLLAFFVRRTDDRASAEDLVQQTLLNMHRARHGFVRGSDVMAWAFAIGRRLMVDAHRRRKHEGICSTEEGARAVLELPSCDGEPDELAWARQLAARVAAEIAALPAPQRAAYDLVRADGLSLADAAARLGTTTPAVKQRVHRASEALRAALAGAGAGR